MELILCQRIRQKKKIYTMMQNHKVKKYRWVLEQNEFGPGDQKARKQGMRLPGVRMF